MARKPASTFGRDALIALLLAAGTAAVVVWQNSRLAVLWDFSYILENASRIAAGDIPYRDFPFPYAPLTFVVQAWIIRLFGHSYALHIAYAAIAAAMATALTYMLVRIQGNAPSTAAILSAPLVVLGIYCIFPHPFYDPDACLVILAVLALFVTTRSPAARFLAGFLAVVPLFVKQNIGLAFVGAAIVLLLIARDWPAIAGILTAVAAGAAAISATAGMHNYIQWTIRFAAQRRLPPLAEELSIYEDHTLWWWMAIAIVGALVALKWRWPGVVIATVPWLWTAYDFFTTDDPNEPEINFLMAWPLMLVAAALLGLFVWRREKRMPIVPFLSIAATLGAFLSQITWGSTYGIWPLLIVLIAFAIPQVARENARAATAAALVIAAVTLLEGVPYVVHNNRLTYAKVGDGDLHRSSIPRLRGLTMRGPWIPAFEELVAWTDAHIPRGDAILCMPGEDLFYFTTGRRPRVPVLMFDRTINPYDATELASIAVASNVRWVIVKRRLQLNGTPMENLGATMKLLAPRLRPAAHLSNYDIYAMR